MRIVALTPLALLAALLAAYDSRLVVHAQPSRLIVASGLDNPRGLDFGPDNFLYIVEAGRGGPDSPCLPPPGGAPPGAPMRCYGPTAAITRVRALGDQQRIVTGLPSLAGPDGSQATGPHDIAFGFGAGWLTIGLGADPAQRAPFDAAGIPLGSLVRIDPTGAWRSVLDLSAYEAADNPDDGIVDSNPYGLLVTSRGGAFVDAGANAVLGIAPTGGMSLLAVLPPREVPHPFMPGTVQMQAVPTTVVQAPDGGYFVGELTGFPFPPGAARVYRIPGGGGEAVPVAGGFTNVIDIALAPSGVGYVLEHDADGLRGPGRAGRLVQVRPDGTTTELTHANLTLPGGVAIGPDGALYVTNNSTSVGTGEVVRITP